jgi:hypothetical protein
MTSKQDKRLLPDVEQTLSTALGRKIDRATGNAKAARRVRPTLAVLFASLALTGTALAAVTGWNPLSSDSAPPDRRCGSFASRNSSGEPYVVTVTSQAGASCRQATAVIGAFWSPKHLAVHHGGQSVAESYYTLKGFPGWRCSEAAGAGLCSRRGEAAGYEVLNAGQESHTRPVKEPAGAVLAVASAKGVGPLRLGETIASLRRRHLIGPVGEGQCYGDRDERGAGLEAPLSGFAYFTRGKLSTLSILGGAETAKHIQVGSTLAEARKSYPNAPFDSSDTLLPVTGEVMGGVLWVNRRFRSRIAFTTIPGMYRWISEIDIPGPIFCERSVTDLLRIARAEASR